MKRKYTKPELDMILFSEDDMILTTSGIEYDPFFEDGNIDDYLGESLDWED